MLNKTVAVLCLMLSSTFAWSEELSWQDYISTAWKNEHFRTIAYQFRHTDSYKELKQAFNNEKKYKKKEMREYFDNNDPFALYLMADFFKKNEKRKQYLGALERLYGYGTPYAKYITARRMIHAFDGAELTALEGGYQLFFKNRHVESELDEFKTERYEQIVEKYGYKKVDKKMMEISERITQFEAAAGAFEFRMNLPPIEVQKREDNPAEIKVIQG